MHDGKKREMDPGPLDGGRFVATGGRDHQRRQRQRPALGGPGPDSLGGASGGPGTQTGKGQRPARGEDCQ